MSILSPRALLFSAIALALAGAGYAVYWSYAASAIEDGFAAWSEARRAEGYTVAHGGVSVGGFPAALRLNVKEPAIGDPRRGWSWKGRRVGYEMAPWNWRWYRVDFEGPHDAVLTIGGRRRSYVGDSGNAVFIGRMTSGGRMARGALDLSEVSLRDRANGDVMTIGQILMRADAGPSVAGANGDLSVTVLADRIRLTPGMPLALGRDVARVEAKGKLRTGPPARLDRVALDQWRRAGGLVDLDWLKVVWGPLDLRAKGTLTVDRRLRPVGAVTADIRGFNETIDLLERGRVLHRKQAAATRMVLSLLAKPEAAGGPSVLTVPVTAQDGKLYFGFVQLFELPPIPFPAP